MKIVSRFFMLFLCLVLASACAQDEPLAPENGGNTSTPELSTRTIHMTAGTASAGDATRTTLNGVNVLWDEGDQFRVMDTNGLDWVMTADEDAKAHTSGGFTGSTNSDVKPTNTAMAVFPSDGLTSYTDGNLTITIPQTQTYVAGSFDHKASVMVGPVTPVTGETDTYSAEFFNMMGVLKLQLTGNQTVSSIALMDNDPNINLWGTATLSAANFLNGITTTNISNGGHIIVLDCPIGVKLSQNPTPFYFVVPTGAFANGFTATVYTTDNKYQDISTTKSQTISKNSIKAMKAVEVEATETVEEVDIENQFTTTYKTSANYENWDSQSFFCNTNKTANNTILNQYVDKDYPEGKKIDNLKGDYQVSLIDVTKGNSVYVDRKISTTSSYTFINLVPNHIYTYTIKQNNNIISSGKFRATGQIRWVKINDSWNCRDLGGWTSSLGGNVQYEWIYRTGSLNGTWTYSGIVWFGYNSKLVGNADNYTLSNESKLQIREELGIKAELDLRAGSSDSDGSKKRHGITLDKENLGVNDSTKYCFYNISTGEAQSSPFNDPAVVKDVAWIIAQVVYNNRPVAFHCLAGADRTGCVGMTILSLLGVNNSNVLNDYELTNFSSENKMITGTSKRKDNKTINNLSSNYKFFKEGFTAYGNDKGDTWQKKAYYYLNQQFATSGYAISSIDLDRFIAKMLGLPSYTQDGGVETGKTLQEIYSK